MAERPVLGLIVGNRSGFPARLVAEGRAVLLVAWRSSASMSWRPMSP